MRMWLSGLHALTLQLPLQRELLLAQIRQTSSLNCCRNMPAKPAPEPTPASVQSRPASAQSPAASAQSPAASAQSTPISTQSTPASTQSTPASTQAKSTAASAEPGSKTGILSEQPASIKTLCQNFVKRTDGNFSYSEKLIQTLQISCQDVYLTHDDTLMHTGKNGFAITEQGIYCKGLGDPVTHTSFQELERAKEIVEKSHRLYADEKDIAYFTTAVSSQKALQNLYHEIQGILRQVDVPW